jgi:serine/threonine-protein kinase
VSSRRYRLAIALGAAAVVAISAVAVWRQRSASSGADSVSRSIAVLPLVNASGDTATQYFVDGMTDELTDALGRVSGLRVASRSAAGSIDTRHSVDPKQAGQRLHVGAVLEGRVRKDGTRLRLAMQLTNAEDGLSLWSESYEREVTDAFAVQDDVARAIASALSVRLAGAPPASSHGTANPEAHDLVLRARYQISLYTEPSLHQAISLLDRAVTLDSTYADAWAGLADAWGRLGDDFLPAKDALVHVRPALARALKLDSLNPNVLAQLATVQFFYDRAVTSADRTFRRVLAQDPSNENAVTYAWLLLTDGKKDSAAAVIARLAQLDPLNRLLAAGAPMKLASAGRIQAANEACRRATELDSLAFSGCRLDVRYFSGHAEQNLVDPICIEAPWCIPEMLGRLGRTKEAQRGAVNADTRMTGRGYLNPAVPARMWADVGNADSAMAWLARVEHNQGAQLALLTWEPAFASLHRDPRFQALVKRSGLR